MAIEGPSNEKTAEKTAKNKAPDDMLDSEKPQTDTTSSVGDKNTVGLQGRDGSDTEYDVDDDNKPFVR